MSSRAKSDGDNPEDADYQPMMGGDLEGDVALDALNSDPPRAITRFKLYGIIGVLIALGTGNFLLLKIVYTAYPAKYSFFVNQGINLLYVLFGALVIIPRIIWTKDITPEMRRYPQWPFFVMGVLDSLGTFFTAMGTHGTPGAATPLLNQTLIPFTMLFSLCILKNVSYHKLEVLGAVIILAGAVLSVMNQVIHPDSGGDSGQIHWYCILFYLVSNIPMACSANYKERNFDEANLDVWYLTQWVSTYQFLFSFLYMPFLCLPGFAGNTSAIPVEHVFRDFWGGVRCFAEIEDECQGQSTMILLIGYTVINMLFNTLGLYVVQQASAVVCYITYALLLPITSIMFSAHFLGKYQESLSGYTFGGLALVLVGFVIYQRYSESVTDTAARDNQDLGLADQSFISDKSSAVTGQSSFQERVVGMRKAHRGRAQSMCQPQGGTASRARAGSV